MILRDLDLNLLRVLHQLLIDRRVSTAAEHLGLTQPAVSNALRRLRTALGDPLFVRTPRGMQPTHLALQLAGPVAQALQTLRDALEHAEAFQPGASRRTFILAMSDIGETYFMPRLMAMLAKEAPHCAITTVRSSAIALGEAMHNGTIDLALGVLPQLQAGFHQRHLFRHGYVGMCRRGHPLLAGKTDLDAFCRYGHVRIAAVGTAYNQVDAWMQRAGIRRDVRLEVPHFVAVGHILKQTDLLAIVPERFASSCEQPFGLASFTPPLPLPEIDINLFWHARRHNDPGNRWLRQRLVDVFADPPIETA